ncbi:MAG: ABC transporter permease [Desulfobacteraceae bacterium]|nr:ABC transporter permease [Desulfobacteraceae bacterium]
MSIKAKLTNWSNSAKRYLDNTFVFTLIAIFIGLITGAIILAFAGFNPFESYWAMAVGIFSKPKYIIYTIIKATPIIITGYSVAFAFRTGLFNIGAEGQFIVGGIVAALAGYFLHLPPVIHAMVAFALAVGAAAAWGAAAGYLKARFGVHEVISTIMLNWIALYLSNYLVMSPAVKRAESEATHKILATARIDLFGVWKVSEQGMAWRMENRFFHDLLKPDINIGIIVAILLGVMIFLILKKTTLGYELRAVGFNKDAAENGGINVNRSFMSSMAIAGGLAGAAGALQVLGVSLECVNLSNMEGYGFDGIAVALIGGNTPAGCFLSGLLFGALKYGGGKLQSMMGAPREIISIVIGTILFFTAMPKLIRYFTSRINQKREEK